MMQHQATIAIIGSSNSTILSVFTVLLAMGTGGNLCSYIGACVDIVTGDRTVFDGFVSLYAWWKGDEGSGQERKE